MPPPESPLLLAQFTDTHVVEADSTEEMWVDNTARLREAVDAIGREVPSIAAVLATGDLTNDGRPGEYDALEAALAPVEVPIWPLPGNHDDVDLMRATFPDVPWVDAEHASWTTEIEGLRVIGLDSTREGEPGAEFDDARETWLREQLRTRFDGPTMLAMHHPPLVVGIEWMDRSGFVGLDRLTAVLEDHPVDRIVCGHMHRPITSSIAGITVQVGLSTVQSVALDLGERSTPAVICDPAGYLVHRIADDQIVTHTRYIATGESPIVPAWAEGSG